MSSACAVLSPERVSSPFRLSVPGYFAFVAAATALGFAGAALLRPTLAYSIREVLGLEKPLEASPHSFYTLRVSPLFEEHCTGCHGARRQKAKLRLDSYAATMRSGRHGAVIKPGRVRESELVSRITLPPKDPKVMPPEGKRPLQPDDVIVIKLWIAAGASGTQAVDAIKGAPKRVTEVKFAEIDEAAVARARAPLAAQVARLQARFPNIIAYESRASADLQVNGRLLRALFGDADLRLLAPLADHIVWADLSNTAVSDASAEAIGAMRHLRVLRLTNTDVTDVVTQMLLPIGTLQSLTVVETSVTEKFLGPLRRRGVKVYDGKDAEGRDDGEP